MNIVRYPDPRLMLRTQEIPEITPEILARIEQMTELMYEFDGVGLAAPQVGWSVRLFLMNPTGDRTKKEAEQVVINPRIRKRRGRALGEEGCLSFPGIFVEVERARAIVVEWTDLCGARHEASLTDFPSRVFQHEFDHLENILLVHRMTEADRVRHKDALDELRNSHSVA